ncbi:carotenoid 1,2-hydratase [Aggregicoccus sp. 17bor-14]|uniref:carotenoid 1,2-hydratase n=1 Tax=Myxococcaceae TaxID=31 RepID=UPI00129CA876|nr:MULTISPECIES: carotenoid 1,2-hydratase [Myxococcaceae]MBF5042986.1 carotenoid 1,2-hydratase [Simulacricoccus sp. 17bor-14]MRI88752.1 carotenoid 1,2-hydratase [Aggregicoccus sp. 17bor-14]
MRACLPPLPELPRAAGAYRWFYADVSAGDYSAVCIFMLGSLFSPRYAVRASRGGLPLEHCAVNFALYHRGQRRCWVLSEYPQARVSGGTHLAIGRSQLVREPDGSVRMEVDERSAPWGRPVRAQLRLEPLTPPGEEVRLVEGLPHAWQALAPRARARLQVDGLELEGLGYHDTNHGEEPLGRRLQRWAWTRTHLEDRTLVDYRLPDGTLALRLDASERGVSLERHAAPGDGRTGLTGWGLRVPRQLHGGEAVSPRLLESSPFYARVEARGQGVDALGEVADFRRFHSPFIRWMAHFRTRVERAA